MTKITKEFVTYCPKSDSLRLIIGTDDFGLAVTREMTADEIKNIKDKPEVTEDDCEGNKNNPLYL